MIDYARGFSLADCINLEEKLETKLKCWACAAITDINEISIDLTKRGYSISDSGTILKKTFFLTSIRANLINQVAKEYDVDEVSIKQEDKTSIFVTFKKEFEEIKDGWDLE